MDLNPSLVPDAPWYRRERWLAVLVAALAVMIIAPFLPNALLRPAIGGGLVLTVAGLVMLGLRESSRPPQ